jgi:hypothetical protein
MVTRTVLVVAICGIGATVPTLAQDGAKIFQYSPIPTRSGGGHISTAGQINTDR